MAVRVVRVLPIYGWGWASNDPEGAVETPAPFHLSVASSQTTPKPVWRGRVTQPGHVLDGLHVVLTSRREPHDGDFNLEASLIPASGETLRDWEYRGFAMIQED